MSDEPEQEDGFDDITRFLLGRFLDLGFGYDTAVMLADGHADWHRVKDLLDRGCDHKTAFKIVA